jgi:Protein of unknown function (DUF3501)
MKKVERNELLGLAEYEQIRPHFRGRMIEAKRRRRLILGEHMSLVFENHDSALLQVQEMLRTERISDELAIAHELQTYNELIPPPGGLCGTLFIEYDDLAERARMLTSFATLREAVHLKVGEQRFTASFSTHHGEEFHRLPAVNYLTFQVGVEQAPRLLDPAVPAALEISHPEYTLSLSLDRAAREELARDLTS